MGSTGLIAVAAAAAVATLVAWWGYARREEPVPGRAAPAVLRGLALFLVLAGWWLPPVWTSSGGESRTALLVDRSLSMTLPASIGGVSRADSSARLAEESDAAVVFWFGDSARAPAPGAAGAPADGASRLVPGLEAARAAGADSVVVLTDGELDDREAARAAARRLGLAVDEVRVSTEPRRAVIRAVDAPRTVEAGDSLRLVVEIATVGEGEGAGADSAGLSVDAPDGSRLIRRFRLPTPGRSIRVPVGVATAEAGDAWRSYDVRLQPGADPLGPPPPHRVWVEVVPSSIGALVVSADPDWEPHYLLPVLARSTAGGARAWLRVGSDHWIRSGTDRTLRGNDARVRREAAAAELLVVQGAPSAVPGWLAGVAARHPRVLWLARGPGPIPGSGLRVGAALPGEWYPGAAPPPSPIAGYLDGLDHPSLPPVARVYALDGYEWAPLELRRNRAGEGRPPIGAARAGDRRQVVVGAEGLWRWSSRAGPARQAYRSLFAGLAGWLLEAPERHPVEAERTRLVAGDTIRWRLAPGVEDLRLTLRDSSGAALWRDSVAAPDSLVAGPPAPEGSVRYEASGVVDGEPFETGRPLEVEGAGRELAARPPGPSLDGASAARGGPPGGGRPVWPFVLAALMLSGEWVLRRRIGLR